MGLGGCFQYLLAALMFALACAQWGLPFPLQVTPLTQSCTTMRKQSNKTSSEKAEEVNPLREKCKEKWNRDHSPTSTTVADILPANYGRAQVWKEPVWDEEFGTLRNSVYIRSSSCGAKRRVGVCNILAAFAEDAEARQRFPVVLACY